METDFWFAGEGVSKSVIGKHHPETAPGLNIKDSIFFQVKIWYFEVFFFVKNLHKCTLFNWKHSDLYKSNETYKAYPQHWNVENGYEYKSNKPYSIQNGEFGGGGVPGTL